MVEFLIIFIVIICAILYVAKTLKTTFSKRENPCDTCTYHKCPYTDISKCPTKTMNKQTTHLSSFIQNNKYNPNKGVILKDEKPL